MPWDLRPDIPHGTLVIEKFRSEVLKEVIPYLGGVAASDGPVARVADLSSAGLRLDPEEEDIPLSTFFTAAEATKTEATIWSGFPKDLPTTSWIL